MSSQRDDRLTDSFPTHKMVHMHTCEHTHTHRLFAFKDQVLFSADGKF